MNYIEKWQIASRQIPDDIYEADCEDYLSEAESLHKILTNAYLYLEASAICEVSSAAKNMEAKLMEELTYEINYLQNITLKKTDDENTDVLSDIIALRDVEADKPNHANPREFDSSYRSTTPSGSTEQHIALVVRESIKRTDLPSVTTTVESNRSDARTTDTVNTELSRDTVTEHTPPQTACSSISVNMQSYVDDTKSSINVAVYCNEAQQQIVDQKTVSSDSTNQVVPSSVFTSVETDCQNDTTTAVSNATSVHRTPDITVDEETIDCAITRYDEATTIMTEQTFTTTEASSAYTCCTEQLNKALPAADASVCVQEHITELQTQVTTKDPATTHPQSTMPYNSESKSTLQISTDTEGHIIYHSKFWDHPDNIYDNQKTPEYVGIVQICRHSVYNCEILYLLLYS